MNIDYQSLQDHEVPIKFRIYYFIVTIALYFS